MATIMEMKKKIFKNMTNKNSIKNNNKYIIYIIIYKCAIVIITTVLVVKRTVPV